MTHSHDRTLLAKLGFQDPDKKDRRHAMACAFLGQEEVASSVLEFIVKGSALRACGASAEFEVPLSKGEGQYKTTIGFLDLEITGEAWRPRDGGKVVYKNDSGELIQGSTFWYHIPVEVKIRKVGIDECVRQINLYKEYFERRCGNCPECEFNERVIHGRGQGMVFGYSNEKTKPRECSVDRTRFILATYFDIMEFEKEMLDRSNIRHIRLGSGFEKFMSEQQQ